LFGPTNTKDSDDDWIEALNVAVIADVNATPVAPKAGDLAVTVGAASVVNDHDTGAAIAVPSASFAPLTVAV
jgi:hypothetical protein